MRAEDWRPHHPPPSPTSPTAPLSAAGSQLLLPSPQNSNSSQLLRISFSALPAQAPAAVEGTLSRRASSSLVFLTQLPPLWGVVCVVIHTFKLNFDPFVSRGYVFKAKVVCLDIYICELLRKGVRKGKTTFDHIICRSEVSYLETMICYYVI